MSHTDVLRPLALTPALAALALAMLSLVLLDQGAAVSALGSTLNSATTHELFHDTRHVLAIPCH